MSEIYERVKPMGGLRAQRGLTLVEVVVALVILSLGLVLGIRYGTDNRLKKEASKLANGIWELRSQATLGQMKPCVDFPDSTSVRFYNEYNNNSGMDSDDSLKTRYTYASGIRMSSATGGNGSTHCVCFDARGVSKSFTNILKVTLKAQGGSNRTILVQVGPATGIPKVIYK